MKIDTNGIELYYEITGNGPPLLLLHGNGESSAVFSKLIPGLAMTHTVYAIDSRNHGKSGLSAESTYEDMAQDISELIRILQLEKPLLFGFSDGGIIGLLIAIRHPEQLSALAVAGTNTHPSGLKKWFLLGARFLHFFTRNKLIRMMLEQPDISEEELSSISIPTLVLAGSNDLIRTEHTKFIATAIKNAKLHIFAREGHATYIDKPEKLLKVLNEKGFLSIREI